MQNNLTIISLLLVALLSVVGTAPADNDGSQTRPGYLKWLDGRKTSTVDNVDDGLPPPTFQSDRPYNDERAPKSLKRLTSCKNGNKFLKTKLKNQKQQYKDKLEAIKNILGELMGNDFDDPSVPMKEFCLKGNEVIESTSTDNVLNDYGAAGSAQPCQLSQWAKWNPLAFGTLERRRTIIKQGCGCPPPEELVETIDILPFLGNGSSQAFADPDKVGDNFGSDFLNPMGGGNGNGAGGTTNGIGGPGGSTVRDILMILDSSGSIETDDFDMMKEGLVAMIGLFCGGFGPADTNHRLAIVQFASNVTIIHRFGDSQNPKDLKRKVMGLRHYKGNTCTGNALKKSMLEVFTEAEGMRTFTAKDTLIVTDGQSNCGIDIRQASLDLQNSSMVFALGVGIAEKIKARDEVRSVVSGQDPHHIFSLAKFSDFKEMVTTLKRRQAQNGPCTPIVGP